MEQQTPILVEGYLWKLGKRLKKWNKRWLIVRNDGWLYCQKCTAAALPPKKLVDLSVCMIQDEAVEIDGRFHIIISSAKREHRLASKNLDEIRKWLTYIQIAADMNCAGRRSWNRSVTQALSLPTMSPEQITAIFDLPPRDWNSEWQVCSCSDNQPRRTETEFRNLCRLHSLQRQFQSFTRIAARAFVLWQTKYFGNNNTPPHSITSSDWFKQRHGQSRKLQSIAIGGVLFEIASDWSTCKLLNHEVRASAMATQQISGAPSFAENIDGMPAGVLRSPLATVIDCFGYRVFALASLELLDNSLLQLQNEPENQEGSAPQDNGVVGHRAANGDLYVLGTPMLLPPDPAALASRAVAGLLVPQSEDKPLQVVEFWLPPEVRLPAPLFTQRYSSATIYPASALGDVIPQEVLCAYGCDADPSNAVLNARATDLADQPIRGDVVVVMPMVSASAAAGGYPLQLRPEWVQKSLSNAALQSAASSTLQRFESSNQDVVASIVPKLAQQMCSSSFFEMSATPEEGGTCRTMHRESVQVVHGQQLTDVLHQAGCNVRYLPMFRLYIQPHDDCLRKVIEAELVARTAKNALRTRLQCHLETTRRFDVASQHSQGHSQAYPQAGGGGGGREELLPGTDVKILLLNSVLYDPEPRSRPSYANAHAARLAESSEVEKSARTFWGIESRAWLLLGSFGAFGQFIFTPAEASALKHLGASLPVQQLLPPLLRHTRISLTPAAIRRLQHYDPSEANNSGSSSSSSGGSENKGNSKTGFSVTAADVDAGATAIARTRETGSGAQGLQQRLAAICRARARASHAHRRREAELGQQLGGAASSASHAAASALASEAAAAAAQDTSAPVSEVEVQAEYEQLVAVVFDPALPCPGHALASDLGTSAAADASLRLALMYGRSGKRTDLPHALAAAERAVSGLQKVARATAQAQAPAELVIGATMVRAVARAALTGAWDVDDVSGRVVQRIHNHNHSASSMEVDLDLEDLQACEADLLCAWQGLQLTFSQSEDGHTLSPLTGHPLGYLIAERLAAIMQRSEQQAQRLRSASAADSDVTRTLRRKWLQATLMAVCPPSHSTTLTSSPPTPTPMSGSGASKQKRVSLWDVLESNLLRHNTKCMMPVSMIPAIGSTGLAPECTWNAVVQAKGQDGRGGKGSKHGSGGVLPLTLTLTPTAYGRNHGKVLLWGEGMGVGLDEQARRRNDHNDDGDGDGDGGGVSASSVSAPASAPASASDEKTLPEGALVPAPSHLTCVWQVSCGFRHTALVSTNGLLHTFGHGECGRLGLGSEFSFASPQLVEHLAVAGVRTTAVSCGREHTCSVALCGALYVWGWGEAGRLGLGETGKELLPVKVKALQGERVRAVACGREHTLVATSRRLYSCGAGYSGRLGLGHTKDALVPTRVRMGVGASGGSSMGGSGSARGVISRAPSAHDAWGGADQADGYDGYGSYDDDDDEDRVVCIAGGEAHSAAVTESGMVYTWGFGGSGALGHGDEEAQLRPKRVEALAALNMRMRMNVNRSSSSSGSSNSSSSMIKIACGAYHTVALSAGGECWVWGDGDAGQLGLPDRGNAESHKSLVPVMLGSQNQSQSLQRGKGLAAAAVVNEDKENQMNQNMNRNMNQNMSHPDLAAISHNKIVVKVYLGVAGTHYKTLLVDSTVAFSLTADAICNAMSAKMSELNPSVDYSDFALHYARDGVTLDTIFSGKDLPLAATESRASTTSPNATEVEGKFVYQSQKQTEREQQQQQQQQQITQSSFSKMGKMGRIADIACGSFTTAAVSSTGELFQWGCAGAADGMQPTAEQCSPRPCALGLLSAGVAKVAAGGYHVVATSQIVGRWGRKAESWNRSIATAAELANLTAAYDGVICVTEDQQKRKKSTRMKQPPKQPNRRVPSAWGASNNSKMMNTARSLSFSEMRKQLTNHAARSYKAAASR